MKTAKLEIAIYKGEDMLCMGTVSECAKKLGVSQGTIRFGLSPTYRKRVDNSKNPDKWKTYLRLNDED